MTSEQENHSPAPRPLPSEKTHDAPGAPDTPPAVPNSEPGDHRPGFVWDNFTWDDMERWGE